MLNEGEIVDCKEVNVREIAVGIGGTAKITDLKFVSDHQRTRKHPTTFQP